MPKQPNDEPPVVVGKAYDFTLWLVQKVEKFPRSYRFTVGDRLATSALDLLLLLVEASYSSKKGEPLRQALVKVNAVRYLLRLAKDLRLLSVDSYGFACENLDEIGRMSGGWHRSSTERT